MSRSRYIGKKFKEWWGKRPLAHYTVSDRSKTNKYFKRLLHKKERAIGKKGIKDELNSL